MGEISEIQQEAQLVREIPRQLLKSVANCKDMYSDVFWTLQVKFVLHFCLFQPYYLEVKIFEVKLFTICSFGT